MKNYVKQNNYLVIFSHQDNDKLFNRGALKNMGFLYAKSKYPNNYKNITEDIKKFRQIIINEEKDTSLKKLSDSLDFYATSTTRDLLFHTQEHRFTIPEISKILNDLMSSLSCL